jgi:hypothetical protein
VLASFGEAGRLFAEERYDIRRLNTNLLREAERRIDLPSLSVHA